MKILKRNKGEITVKVEHPEDVWVLSQIVNKGDFASGKTERKIKIGDDTDRNVKIIRKTIFIQIQIEKVEVVEGGTQLRLLGVISDGPEDISRGEHHSFKLENESIITIKKENWLKYQLQKLKEATSTKSLKILLTIFDREEAYFAKLVGNGYQVLGKIQGDVSKKEEKHVSKGNFYKEILSKIAEYSSEYEYIVVASPGFWKENLLKILPEDIKKKTISATISSVNERALNELIKRDELKKILSHNRASLEEQIIDKVLEGISNEKATYGLNEVKEKITIGAVKELILSQNFLEHSRENNTFHEIEKMIVECENMEGLIHIISTDESKKRIDGLAGIAALLRWNN